MSGLEIAGLFKSYDTQTVLRGLDLRVAPGSFCSILGPSGSGKTTLLRVVAGFERADAGRVVLDGSTLDDTVTVLAPERRRIGYVPQEGALFPHLNVAQNVGFGLARRERRSPVIDELLEMVGLGGFATRLPHELSGGQQQRVALARALAIEPALVLLDEPFSSLDATLRAGVRADVRRVLAESGTTALLVTHDQDEALSISDQVAVIADGVIGQVGAPQDLYAHPANAQLAAGIGDANFLRGIIIEGIVETPLGPLVPETGGLADGTEVLVLVRPEQLVLVTASRSNAVGTVVDREYFGHDAIVRVRGEWSPESELLARVTELDNLPEPGQRVGLVVRGTVVTWMRAEAPERRGRHHRLESAHHHPHRRGRGRGGRAD